MSLDESTKIIMGGKYKATSGDLILDFHTETPKTARAEMDASAHTSVGRSDRIGVT